MLGIALLGAGRIGSVHAANIAANPRARLACIYDAIPAAAAGIAERFRTRIAASVEEVLRDKLVDAVVIASPTATHVELITAAARAGKAILCEKPIDLDIAAVERCKREIAASGVPLQIGFNRRYDRSHRAVRDAVHRGEIGALELLVISSRDFRPAPLAYLRTSGGIFRDMTIHDFDMARFILGEDPVAEVQVAGSVMVEPALSEFGDVDTAMIILKAASGALVHINNSRRCVYGYDQRIEAFGASGMVRSENLHGSSVVRSDAKYTDAKQPLLEFFVERYAQAYADEIEEFIEVAAGTRAPLASFEDGRLALVLADAAVASLQSGKTVRVACS
jgi:myo-inositol 2-dehydrogenase/D-chiro-inositol 1-dehydrogenase